MQVILLEKIRKLGNLGAIVSVKSGYARNYLIPKGKVVVASEANKVLFEERKAELLLKANKMLAEAQVIADKLHGTQITISALASDEGKLYGSISTNEVKQAIFDATNLDIEKKDIKLPFGPIRVLGESEVFVQLHGDLQVKINIVIDRKTS